MYTPPSNRESRPEVLRDLIESYSFGTLVTTGGAGPEATHLPFLMSSDGKRLRGHMARANRQWQRFDEGPVLAIFQGPHAYISPTFYEAEFAVPTWNYVALHVTGTALIVDDPTTVRGFLDDLVAHNDEQGWTMPWQDERSDALLAAIVAFEIDIERLEGKAKLGQNRPPEDRRGMARALSASSRPGDRELAQFIADFEPREDA